MPLIPRRSAALRRYGEQYVTDAVRFGDRISSQRSGSDRPLLICTYRDAYDW